jgi:hypothetical protein
VKRRWPYLVTAVILLGLGAWLTSGGDPVKPQPQEVEMPRGPTPQERKRLDERRTLAPPLPAVVLPDQPPPRPRDPVLAAMPHEVKQLAMVVEANALRNSDLGDAMVACFMAGAPGALEEARDAGFDPLTQLDRVSLFDQTLMMTGNFSAVSLPSESTEKYGDATLFHQAEQTAAVWRGQAMLVGSSEDVKQAIDRLEGRGSSEPPALGEGSAYGELYGLLKPDSVSKLFDGVDPKLSDFVKVAAQSVELHVDAMHDVGVVADVKGTNPEDVNALRRMMGGAVAAARARAAAEGHPEAAEVLDLSRVMGAEGDGKTFRMELGLPYDLLKAQLDRCVTEGKKRAAQRVATDAGP